MTRRRPPRSARVHRPHPSPLRSGKRTRRVCSAAPCAPVRSAEGFAPRVHPGRPQSLRGCARNRTSICESSWRRTAPWRTRRRSGCPPATRTRTTAGPTSRLSAVSPADSRSAPAARGSRAEHSGQSSPPGTAADAQGPALAGFQPRASQREDPDGRTPPASPRGRAPAALERTLRGARACAAPAC